MNSLVHGFKKHRSNWRSDVDICFSYGIITLYLSPQLLSAKIIKQLGVLLLVFP